MQVLATSFAYVQQDSGVNYSGRWRPHSKCLQAYPAVLRSAGISCQPSKGPTEPCIITQVRRPRRRDASLVAPRLLLCSCWSCAGMGCAFGPLSPARAAAPCDTVRLCVALTSL
jgi:hypothetical protein